MKEVKQRSECPISSTLDFLGDKWSLLILRDIMLGGKVTFGEFLDSKEKIATNILTDRLKNLENCGFIFKHPVPGKARIGYSLTEKGISLLPLVVEFIKWGASQGYLDINPDSVRNIAKHSDQFIKKTNEALRVKLERDREEFSVENK